jgi:hypothetical protein
VSEALAAVSEFRARGAVETAGTFSEAVADGGFPEPEAVIEPMTGTYEVSIIVLMSWVNNGLPLGSVKVTAGIVKVCVVACMG